MEEKLMKTILHQSVDRKKLARKPKLTVLPTIKVDSKDMNEFEQTEMIK